MYIYIYICVYISQIKFKEKMIESPNHVGELQWCLFPYYGLTNCVAALRAYQLNEINIIIRAWMVIGLVGGVHGHMMDFIQVLKGDNRLYFDVIKASKTEHWVGMALLGFPSLLGIYAMAYLYISNVSGWSNESYILVVLVCVTLGYDLYYTFGWGTSFHWHKNHVLAHCVFLISEYTATGYFAERGEPSNSFFGIQLVIAICLEVLLYFPHLVFHMKTKASKLDAKRRQDNEHKNNMRSGALVFVLVFVIAFGLDIFIKRNSFYAYIPAATNISL